MPRPFRHPQIRFTLLTIVVGLVLMGNVGCSLYRHGTDAAVTISGDASADSSDTGSKTVIHRESKTSISSVSTGDDTSSRDSGNAVSEDSSSAINTTGGESYSEDITVDANGHTTKKIWRNGVLAQDSTKRYPLVHEALDRTIAASGVRQLAVTTKYGDIAVTAARDSAHITVHAAVTVDEGSLNAADRARLAPKFLIATDNKGSTLNVHVQPPPDFPKSGHFGASIRIEAPADITLNLSGTTSAIHVQDLGPGAAIVAASDYGGIHIQNSGTDIDAHTRTGTVDIESSAPLGNVSAASDYGDIVVKGDSSRIDATTRTGSVTVRGAAHAHAIDAHSSYGNIVVSGSGGAIDAQTSTGTVTLDDSAGSFASDITGRSEYGAVTARIGGASALHHVDLFASTGVVTLTAARDASLSISAHAANGAIDAEGISGNRETASGDKSFTGSLNGGRIPVSLRSGYGTVVVRAQ